MKPDEASNAPVKVFKLNDYEWYAARTLEEAKTAYLAEFDGDLEDLEDAYELSDEEMNNTMFWDSDNEDRCDPEHFRCDCGYKTVGASKENRWTGENWEHFHGPEGYVTMRNISRISYVEALGRHLAAEQPVPGFFACTES